MLLAILFIQEQALVLIPQFQFTTVLIIVYAAIFPYKILLPMIIAYTILDNLYMGSLSYIYFPPMLLAWLSLAICARALRNKPFYVQIILVTVFGFVYGWFFIPARFLEQGAFDVWLYLKLDLPFEIMMSFSNFVTTMALYQPLKTSLETLMKHYK